MPAIFVAGHRLSEKRLRCPCAERNRDCRLLSAADRASSKAAAAASRLAGKPKVIWSEFAGIAIPLGMFLYNRGTEQMD